METTSHESSGAPEKAAPGATFTRNFPRTLELALDMTQSKKISTSWACLFFFLLYPQRAKGSWGSGGRGEELCKDGNRRSLHPPASALQTEAEKAETSFLGSKLSQGVSLWK